MNRQDPKSFSDKEGERAHYAAQPTLGETRLFGPASSRLDPPREKTRSFPVAWIALLGGAMAVYLYNRFPGNATDFLLLLTGGMLAILSVVVLFIGAIRALSRKPIAIALFIAAALLAVEIVVAFMKVLNS